MATDDRVKEITAENLIALEKVLHLPIDPAKAVKLVRSLICQLSVREDRYYDPLYGWVSPCPYYPSGVLVDAEKIVACVKSSVELGK